MSPQLDTAALAEQLSTTLERALGDALGKAAAEYLAPHAAKLLAVSNLVESASNTVQASSTQLTKVEQPLSASSLSLIHI